MATVDPVDLVPGSDAQAVTKDGKVRKQVLEEGQGDQPPKYARCLVHYVGRLAENGEVFMDTRAETESAEPVALVAGRDTSIRDVGVNLGVATMRKGERARLFVAPEYGYGDKGSFSFPTVPGGADLVYDVELLAFDERPQQSEGRSLLYEERLEEAERRKMDGNDLLKKGLPQEALAQYRMGLSYLDEDLMAQLEGRFYDQAMSKKMPLLLNMALAKLHTGEYADAEKLCSQVLLQQKGNAKALFRRGRARNLLGNHEGALEDLKEASRLDPSDAGIAREMRSVDHKLKEQRQAGKRLFGGKFRSSNGLGLYEEDEAAAAAGPSQQQGRGIGSAAGGSAGSEAAVAGGGPLRLLLAALRSLWYWLQRIFGVPVDRSTPSPDISGKLD